jgi:drug/metabolite transporter (DMT)-like permease
MLNRIIPMDEQSSVVAMMVGAILAGWGDLEFHLIGYVLIVINCLFTAGYLIFIKQTQSLGLGEFALMYYNNIAAVPLYIVIILFTEIRSVIHFPYLFDPGFLVRVIFTFFCFFAPKCLLRQATPELTWFVVH